MISSPSEYKLVDTSMMTDSESGLDGHHVLINGKVYYFRHPGNNGIDNRYVLRGEDICWFEEAWHELDLLSHPAYDRRIVERSYKPIEQSLALRASKMQEIIAGFQYIAGRPWMRQNILPSKKNIIIPLTDISTDPYLECPSSEDIYSALGLHLLNLDFASTYSAPVAGDALKFSLLENVYNDFSKLMHVAVWQDNGHVFFPFLFPRDYFKGAKHQLKWEECKGYENTYAPGWDVEDFFFHATEIVPDKTIYEYLGEDMIEPMSAVWGDGTYSVWNTVLVYRMSLSPRGGPQFTPLFRWFAKVMSSGIGVEFSETEETSLLFSASDFNSTMSSTKELLGIPSDYTTDGTDAENAVFPDGTIYSVPPENIIVFPVITRSGHTTPLHH